MKLKKFDFKLPKEEKRQKKIIITTISVIALILVITIASTFAYYQSIENQNPINTSVGEFSSGDLILTVTIDGIASETFPQKNTGYVVSGVTCDKGASGTWNNSDWAIVVSNLTQSKTTCNTAFIQISTLRDYVLSQGGGTSIIEAKGNSAFNVVPNAATSGLYATEDEYGTSYYYRGERDSLSNNLIFAGFQWKIVRINGDSSIRLIYNGTEAQFNSMSTMNTTGANTQIGTSTFNANFDNNKFGGYMYGVASTSLAQAQSNAINSTIKTYIDTWYANNIGNKGTIITSKLADNLFCNDRQLGREYLGAPTTGIGWNGTGYGMSVTNYASFYRHITSRSNPIPTMKCAQKNDRFTVADTAIGNGSLIQPVGLITADEIVYGGLTLDYYNTSQYLSTSQSFWSMSSHHFDGDHANAWFVNQYGGLTTFFVHHSYGVRPVINLSSNAVVASGDGSATNPFKINS